MKTSYRSRRKALMMRAAAPALALALVAGAVHAQEARRAFEIAPQPLADALLQLSSQADIDIVAAAELTRGRTAPWVSGELTTAEAMNRLLAGSGLEAQVSGGGYILAKVDTDPQSESAAGDGADGTVEALIVTAQKREEDIQDVPIAISAFTQEALERSQVAGGPDLMTQVPNMTFTKTNFTSYSIQIRGIGTQAISATTDPAVAVAFNNTPFVRNHFFEQEFYDLQRVEVLRGPQGTLYGRNATAGVVNVISAKPTFRYEAKAAADVASYNSTRLEGMINVPLAEDAVALRLAGAWTKREGYATNQMNGNPIDGRDLWSTRLSLRISPNDAVDANLIWEHFEENDDRLRSGKQLCKKDLKTEIGGFTMPPIGVGVSDAAGLYSQGCAPVSLYSEEAFQTPNGYSLPYYLPLAQLGLPAVPGLDPYLSATQSRDLRVIESTIDPRYRAKSDLGQLQVSVDLSDEFTLASETAYSTDYLWSMQDYNRFTTSPHAFITGPGAGGAAFPRPDLMSEDGVFCDPQLGCSDRVLVADIATAKSTQFAQELRLSSDLNGRFNFNLGANFLRYDTEDKYYVFINTITLMAANLKTFRTPPPWLPSVTDNHDCLMAYEMGDSTHSQVLNTENCIYIDPNSLENVNDLGHNYFLSKNPYKLISYAVFGEAYYQISDNLKLTGGLRWTVDKKEAPEIPSWLLGRNTIGYPVRSVVEQEWREPTGRVAIDWKPDLAISDETLLYASYAHGYKAGGANPPPAVVVAYGGDEKAAAESLTHPKTFDPEFVDAFEVGAKNTFAGGRITLNLSAFYYDYKAYQISEIVDRAAVNHNYDAEVWGAEIEADWRPVENLRLAFKGGYERTRVADGMGGIDLMDRTAGNTDWIVSRPFPTVSSNCILPVYVVTTNTRVWVPGESSFPNGGPCWMAYQEGWDPMTKREYEPNPQYDYDGVPLPGGEHDGYPGFDPRTAPNNGEGFSKDLSGNELPNAPRFTATITADYTLPLPHEWLMTLHTDLYWQDKAWARIFNYDPYDRIKPYTNVNVATIFVNEDAGWQVMAYIKNVFDKDNITGAFLNSDDTGLTTNVFLNEPRIYGLRVTKEWSDLPWSLGAGHRGTYPLTVELGGAILRKTADADPVSDNSLALFPQTLLPDSLQGRDLDWGDGREVRLTYAPDETWRIGAAARFGKSNVASQQIHSEHGGPACTLFIEFCQQGRPDLYYYPGRSSIVDVSGREDHTLVDFTVGREVGLGGLSRSTVSVGLGYANLKSRTILNIQGIPDWETPDEWIIKYETSTHHWIDGQLTASREFEGAGPIFKWEAAQRLLGEGEGNHADLDWSIGGGILFGRQGANVDGTVLSNSYTGTYAQPNLPHILLDSETIAVNRHRSRSATVPTVSLSLGLSYEIDRFRVGAGYRWERYFDAIDGGDLHTNDFDRTIDGPYLKIAVGFGG